MFRVTPSANADDPRTVHCSISSTPQYRSGTILRIGRKNTDKVKNDITFSNDNAVSRSHLILRLVRLGVVSPPGTPEEEPDDDEPEPANVFDKPRSPDEIAACQAAADGIALVLECKAKFGAAVSYELPCEDGKEQEEDAKPKAKDDDATDDETDDEGGLSQVAAKAVAQRHGKATNIVKRDLAHDGSLILSVLSLPDDDASDAKPLVSANTSDNLPVVKVQLSQKKVSSWIEISRVPLNLCVTRIDAKVKTKLGKIAPESGFNIAHSKEGWNAAPSHPLLAYSHLLAPDLTSTAKSIAAWCLKQPIVTPDFILKGLAGRKSVRDPFPKFEDYEPQTGHIIESDAAKEEAEGNGPFGGLRDPLRGFLVISLVASESEGLVMAAGGTVFRAHLLDDATFNDETWLTELLQAEKDPVPSASPNPHAGGTVILIETTSRKVKKRRDLLRKHNIRCVTQKNIAHAIDAMKAVFIDTDGNEVFGREGMPSNFFRLAWKARSDTEKAKEAPLQDSEAARLSTIQEVSREDVSRSLESDMVASAEKAAIPEDEEEAPAAADVEGSTAAHIIPEEKEPEETQGKRKRGGSSTATSGNKKDTSDGQEKDEESTRDKKRAKCSSKSAGKDGDQQPVEEEEGMIMAPNDDDEAEDRAEIEKASRSKRKQRDEDGEAARPKKKRIAGESREDQDENEERVIRPTSNPNDRRKPLPKKTNGWLSSAPKDVNERAKFKSTKADLEDMDETFPAEAAITVKKKGLVVRSNEEYRERQAQMRAARGRIGPRVVTGRDGKPVKDFKKFRKNVVIRGGRCAIRMSSRLPKESERQRQLEQMQRDFEKDQREAEALFNGEESGSIRSFFGSTAKKSSKKRSRVRR